MNIPKFYNHSVFLAVGVRDSWWIYWSKIPKKNKIFTKHQLGFFHPKGKQFCNCPGIGKQTHLWINRLGIEIAR